MKIKTKIMIQLILSALIGIAGCWILIVKGSWLLALGVGLCIWANNLTQFVEKLERNFKESRKI